jgi:chaperonin cofactor prefoldin
MANNPQIAAQILKTTNGGTLRNLTNRNNLKLTPEQVIEWDNTSKSIMLNLMYDSYVQNPQAAQKLLATGNATITHKVREIEQDNGRFSEVVMTVRDMLKEEMNETQNNIEEFKGFWTREQVAKQTDKVFLFGDNTNDRLNTKYIPSSTQAVIRGLPNAIGIDTKKDRATNNSSYFTDADFNIFKQQVDEAIQKAKNSGKTIVIPADGIGTGKAMLKEKAPELFGYLQQELDNLKKQKTTLQQKELTWDSLSEDNKLSMTKAGISPEEFNSMTEKEKEMAIDCYGLKK